MCQEPQISCISQKTTNGKVKFCGRKCPVCNKYRYQHPGPEYKFCCTSFNSNNDHGKQETVPTDQWQCKPCPDDPDVNEPFGPELESFETYAHLHADQQVEGEKPGIGWTFPEAKIQAVIESMWENDKVQKALNLLPPPCIPEKRQEWSLTHEIGNSVCSQRFKISKMRHKIPLRCPTCRSCGKCGEFDSSKKRCPKCKECEDCPLYHMKSAAEQVHPHAEVHLAVPHLAQCLEELSKMSTEDTIASREDCEDALEQLASATRPFMRKLMPLIHPSIRSVLQRRDPTGANRVDFYDICFIEALARWGQCPDTNYAMNVLRGFPMVGELEHSNMYGDNPKFARQKKKATSVDDLLTDFQNINERIYARMSPTEYDMTLWEESRKDWTNGVLKGPFRSEDKLKSFLHDNIPAKKGHEVNYLVVNRFPCLQPRH